MNYDFENLMMVHRVNLDGCNSTKNRVTIATLLRYTKDDIDRYIFLLGSL